MVFKALVLLVRIMKRCHFSCETMYKVQTTKSAPQCYAQLHLDEPSMPLHFIVIDLKGTFKLSPLEY